MRVVVDDGVGLEVVERGTGPALLLVHGFGGAKKTSRTSWKTSPRPTA